LLTGFDERVVPKRHNFLFPERIKNFSFKDRRISNSKTKPLGRCSEYISAIQPNELKARRNRNGRSSSLRQLENF
jgi:hypothetical protein